MKSKRRAKKTSPLPGFPPPMPEYPPLPPEEDLPPPVREIVAHWRVMLAAPKTPAHEEAYVLLEEWLSWLRQNLSKPHKLLWYAWIAAHRGTPERYQPRLAVPDERHEACIGYGCVDCDDDGTYWSARQRYRWNPSRVN